MRWAEGGPDAIFSGPPRDLILDTLGAWESQQKRADQFREARKLRAFTEAVPRMLLARAALRCGAACRALRYVEQHADETARPTPQEFNLSKGEARRELPADEVALLHAAYGRIDEPDAFVGLGRMRSATSLVEEVRELPADDGEAARRLAG